ncbi:MAG: hypothetical protein M1822_002732 [Bathelium mastoideum]|nr:MAG: hypothetical protein M1822_002732 [Bathelium mastoideum]
MATAKVDLDSKPTTLGLLRLPREIRDEIYDYSCDWNEVNGAIKQYHEIACTEHHDCIPPIPSVHERWVEEYQIVMVKPSLPRFHTPTILLINHQIASEAMEILRKKPLVIEPFPLLHTICSDLTLSISQIISKKTLEHVATLELHLSHDECYFWSERLDTFFDNLCARDRGIKHICITITPSEDPVLRLQTTGSPSNRDDGVWAYAWACVHMESGFSSKHPVFPEIPAESPIAVLHKMSHLALVYRVTIKDPEMWLGVGHGISFPKKAGSLPYRVERLTERKGPGSVLQKLRVVRKQTLMTGPEEFKGVDSDLRVKKEGET